MTSDESACGALVRRRLPEGFSRHVFEVAPGLALEVEPDRVPDAVVVVEHGELELECPAGTCGRFGPGSMIPISRFPVARLRNIGPGPLVLVAVLRATDEFRPVAGSYGDS